MSPFVSLLLYLLGGAALGLLMLVTGIPAAPLAGAILGAGLLSISGFLEIAEWPPGTKTALGIGVGTVIGTAISTLNKCIEGILHCADVLDTYISRDRIQLIDVRNTPTTIKKKKKKKN